jgi:hypothetical protein
VANRTKFDFDTKDIVKFATFLVKMTEAVKDSVGKSTQQRRNLETVIRKINNQSEIETRLQAKKLESKIMNRKESTAKLARKTQGKRTLKARR